MQQTSHDIGMVLAFPSIVSAQSTAIFPELISVKKHDSETFTQGLPLYEGIQNESTGNYGESSLRKINLSTGSLPKRLELLEKYFAEGLARVEDRLIQLTWKAETSFVYDIKSFEELKRFTYKGEGWGLGYNDNLLYMSNVSSSLCSRVPETFEIIKETPVRFETSPITNLNELECVGRHLCKCLAD